MNIRKRRVIEWHDPKVAKGEVRFVRWPVVLWQTEFELEERQVWFNQWELNTVTDKKGNIVKSGKKQIRPIRVVVNSPDEFPELRFVQIDPEWIEREKEILSRSTTVLLTK